MLLIKILNGFIKFISCKDTAKTRTDPITKLIYQVHFKGHQKYLVEHKGDMALLEDEDKAGVGLMTKALYVCHFWLNNEGSIGLEEKERTPCIKGYHGNHSVPLEKPCSHQCLVMLDEQQSYDQQLTSHAH